MTVEVLPVSIVTGKHKSNFNDEPSHIPSVNGKWRSHFGEKSLTVFLKVKCTCTISPNISFPGIYSGEMKRCDHIMFTNVHSRIIYNSPKLTTI